MLNYFIGSLESVEQDVRKMLWQMMEFIPLCFRTGTAGAIRWKTAVTKATRHGGL